VSGEMKDEGRQEWRDEPCGTPLFSGDNRKDGICRSCASGWTHPENYQLPPEECTRCSEELKPGKAVWLELNSHTGEYSKPGTVPPEQSQGVFPFGAACARKALRT